MSYYQIGILAKRIGDPAILEQTAEECTELAKACLKMARYMRGENETYKTYDEIQNNLNEETVDVQICLREIEAVGLIADREVLSQIEFRKRKRMQDRLAGRIPEPEETCKECSLEVRNA